MDVFVSFSSRNSFVPLTLSPNVKFSQIPSDFNQ